MEYDDIKNAPLYINSTLSMIVKEDDSDFQYDIVYDEDSRSVLPQFRSKVRRYTPIDAKTIDVWNENKLKISEGIPIIVGLDNYYLSYHPFYKKNHGRHTAILSGYSEDEKEVYITDWYDPWFFKGTIGFQEFLEARESLNPWDGSVYSGSPVYNNWAEVDKNGWDLEASDLISTTIDLTISQYYCEKKESQNIHKGILGLKKLLDIILKTRDFDLNTKKQFLRDLHYKLFSATKRKKLFRLYLDISQGECKIRELDEAIQLLNYIIMKWDDISIIVLKGSFSKTEEMHQRVIKEISKMIIIEENFYDSLNKIRSVINI